MLPLADARRRLLELAQPVGAIEIPLSEAIGLVLAEPVLADVDMPPFDRAATAGYALRSIDAVPGTQFRIVAVEPRRQSWTPVDSSPGTGRSLAAEVEISFRDVDMEQGIAIEPEDDEPLDDQFVFDLGAEVGPDEAVRVNLGDPLPLGADCVVPLDQTRSETGFGMPRFFEVVEPPIAWQGVIPRGTYLRHGTECAHAGSRIRASMAGLLAAQGCVHPVCHRRVRVAIVAVGDHLIPPGEAPILHRERNSATFSVSSPLLRAGAMVHDLGTVSWDQLEPALERGVTAPVVLILGARGPELARTLRGVGHELIFDGVALEPGGDVAYGVTRNDRGDVESHLFQLPDHPIEAIVALSLLVLPLVSRLQGDLGEDPEILRGVWDGELEAHADRHRVVLASTSLDAEGRRHARPVLTRGRDDLLALATADALAVLPPASSSWRAGDVVDMVSLSAPSL
jgi:molybdopterin biosynthesis enzyme